MPVLRAKDEKDREDHPVWVYAAEVPVYQPCVPEIRGHAAGGVLMATLRGAVFPSLVTAFLGFTLVYSVKPNLSLIMVFLDFLAIYVWSLVFLLSVKEYLLGGRE